MIYLFPTGIGAHRFLIRTPLIREIPLNRAQATKTLWCALLATVLAILSDREIIALESDASVAINMALGYLSGQYPPYYPPGSAFYIATVRSFGVPLRLANIVLTFGCATLVAYLILMPFRSRFLRFTLASLFATFFSLMPTIVYEGDITGNVYFSAVTNLTLYLLLAAAITGSTHQYLLSIGIVAVSALAAISRPDTEILKVSLVVILAIVMVVPWLRRSFGRSATGLVILALVSIFASEFAIKRFNASHYGVDAVASYLDSRYSDLFATIAALPSAEPTDRFFLADTPRRELAYRLSATLAKMQPVLESRTGVGAIGFDAGTQFFQKADIANAFFYWHVDNTLKAAGFTDSQYLPLLGLAAEEIRKAAHEQGISLARPFFGVVSRDHALWIPHLPASLLKIYQHSFRERSHPVSYGTASPELVSAYDRAALRRAVLKDKTPDKAHAYANLYHLIHTGVVWTFPLVVVLGAFCFWRASPTPILQILLLIFAVAFSCRIAYYTLLDASLYRATINYLMPNFILVYPIWLCSIILVVQRIRELYAERSLLLGSANRENVGQRSDGGLSTSNSE